MLPRREHSSSFELFSLHSVLVSRSKPNRMKIAFSSLYGLISLALAKSDLSRTLEYRWQGLMKIFENLALMYGQNFTNFLKIVRTAAGMGPKCQNLFKLTIRPPKRIILFRNPPYAKKLEFLFLVSGNPLI